LTRARQPNRASLKPAGGAVLPLADAATAFAREAHTWQQRFFAYQRTENRSLTDVFRSMAAAPSRLMRNHSVIRTPHRVVARLLSGNHEFATGARMDYDRDPTSAPPYQAELTRRFVDDALPFLTQLHNRARRWTRDSVDAEDLVQETVLRAYIGFNALAEGTDIRAWLFRIMTNAYLNGLRREQHRPREYLTDRITDRQLAGHGGPGAHGQRSAGMDALHAWPANELADALTALPMRFRVGVHFRHGEGLRCREIAATMAGCEGIVVSRLHRGRRRLRAFLQGPRDSRGG
jgi:RNA polymerase sigma-70 factor (ECF subfamily)